jgi:hypothetical protein
LPLAIGGLEARGKTIPARGWRMPAHPRESRGILLLACRSRVRANVVSATREGPAVCEHREAIMVISEYEQRFHPPAPSLHQIVRAAQGGSRDRRRRRIWAVAAAIGVLVVGCI